VAIYTSRAAPGIRRILSVSLSAGRLPNVAGFLRQVYSPAYIQREIKLDAPDVSFPVVLSVRMKAIIS
jgi:hypothetical protein